MFFDFEEFISELREHPEKKEIIEKYEKLVEPIWNDPKDMRWYKEYVSKFETIQYLVPDELKDDFDWDFLMQLVAASFSSEWYLDFEEWKDKPEFLISVTAGDTSIVKKVSELFIFQIKRLYEIYIEEQMQFEILRAEDEQEKEIIDSKRDSKLERWKTVLDKLKSEQEKIKEEQERKKKLEELKNLL